MEKTLASSGEWRDETIRLWDVDTGALKATLIGHTSGINSIAFSPDGRTLASCGDWLDDTMRLWDVTSGALKATLIGHTDEIHSIAFSPDGKNPRKRQ